GPFPTVRSRVLTLAAINLTPRQSAGRCLPRRSDVGFSFRERRQPVLEEPVGLCTGRLRGLGLGFLFVKEGSVRAALLRRRQQRSGLHVGSVCPDGGEGPASPRLKVWGGEGKAVEGLTGNVSSLLSGSRSSKTFKPKKNIPEGSHQYELLKHAEATLGSGNLRQAVMLPEGEDLNEWIAVNTVDFFNQINMLYGTITEFCTEASCPVMSAGPRYEYHWADGTNIKKPIKCSAPKYIDYLMTWVQDQLDDETLPILKRLFRVYAHIYHQHFDSVMRLQEEAHLNTSFKHFIFFVQEFNLIDRRELAPLQELIEKLGSKDR
ncbi:PREDICTED: MOB kinase activator 1A-like, partial [Leptosomus discolor]|uniref:MOB kinase activator 1A-like n=1 Tax=Leptosomus discolor TaxID=188344 RepID=UPI0005223ED2